MFLCNTQDIQFDPVCIATGFPCFCSALKLSPFIDMEYKLVSTEHLGKEGIILEVCLYPVKTNSNHISSWVHWEI